MMIRISVAMSPGGVIGDKGTLPWNVPSDLARFRVNTMGRDLIVGRKTWEAVMASRSWKGVGGRRILVLSRSQFPHMLQKPEDNAPVYKTVADGPDDLVDVVSNSCHGDAWVIGGAEVYNLALPVADEIHLTTVFNPAPGDTVWLPPHILRVQSGFEVVHETTPRRLPGDSDITRYSILRRRVKDAS